MKKYKKSIVYFLLLTLLSFTGCVKEDGLFQDGGNSGSNGIVELSLSARVSSTVYATKTTTVNVADRFAFPITVNYTGSEGAPTDITVTLSIDTAALSKYNKAQSTSYIAPSSALYSFATTVTIPKGKKTGTDTIWLYTKSFDLTLSYALPVKIASASSGTISGNYGTGIYILPVKSPWEGSYSVNVNWLAGGGKTSSPFTETDVSLETQGPGVLQTDGVGQWYSGNTTYTFKADGTINVSVYSGGTRATTVVDSHYDLDKLTFYVKYYFISTSYYLEETWTRTGD